MLLKSRTSRLSGRFKSLLHDQEAARSAFQIVVVVSFLIRFLGLFLFRHLPFASDANEYLQMAGQLLAGGAFIPEWPPGLPLYLAPLLAAGASGLWIRASMLLFWGLCCWGLYRLMEALEIAEAAWLILLIFSFLPDAVHLSIEVFPSVPAAALLIIALGSAVKILQGSDLWKEAVLLGVSLGFLCFIRPSTSVLVIAIPVLLILFGRHFKESVLSFALAFFIVGIWVEHVHGMTGRWLFNTANATNVYYGNNEWTPNYRTWYFGSHAKSNSTEIRAYPEYAEQLKQIKARPELDRPAVFQATATTYIEQHPGRFLLRSANRVRAFFGFDTFTAAALSRWRWHGIPLNAPVLLLESLSYLMLMGPAFYYLGAASRAFWHSESTLLVAASVLLYSGPYWLSMSHPTYHFAIILPIVAIAAVAWLRDTEKQSVLRGGVGATFLLLIQMEWSWQLYRR